MGTHARCTHLAVEYRLDVYLDLSKASRVDLYKVLASRQISLEEMEALLDSLPFYIVLRGIVQAIRGDPQGGRAALREEGLET